MPGPVTICTYPGCNALIPNTEHRCSRHPYPPYIRGKDKRRSSSARGYDADWRWVRRNYLANHPICELMVRCKGDPATEVDHRIPISAGGARLDTTNLQAVCGYCHKWKTAKFDRKKIQQEPR